MVDTWTQVEIAQRKDGTAHTFVVTIGSVEVWSLRNTSPRVFNNVKVFVSDDFYPPVPGIIRNLNIGKVPFVSL